MVFTLSSTPWRCLRPPGRERSQGPSPPSFHKGSSALTWLGPLLMGIPFHLKGSTTRKSGRSATQERLRQTWVECLLYHLQPWDLKKAKFTSPNLFPHLCNRDSNPYLIEELQGKNNNNYPASWNRHLWLVNTVCFPLGKAWNENVAGESRAEGYQHSGKKAFWGWLNQSKCSSASVPLYFYNRRWVM